MFVVCEKNHDSNGPARYFNIGYCLTKEEAIEAVNKCTQDTIRFFSLETAKQLEEKEGISFLYCVIDRFDFNKFKSGDYGYR